MLWNTIWTFVAISQLTRAGNSVLIKLLHVFCVLNLLLFFFPPPFWIRLLSRIVPTLSHGHKHNKPATYSTESQYTHKKKRRKSLSYNSFVPLPWPPNGLSRPGLDYKISTNYIFPQLSFFCPLHRNRFLPPVQTIQVRSWSVRSMGRVVSGINPTLISAT